MAIKIFMHVAQMGPTWRCIVAEIVAAINYSGLYNAADKIYVCHAGQDSYSYPEKYEVNRVSKVSEFEFPALQMLSENSQPGDKCLYLHTKGVSRNDDPIVQGWRRYMIKYCVAEWQACVNALDSHDMAGPLWLDSKGWGTRVGTKQFYAGNYWWATGDYIGKIRAPKIQPNRWLAEGWAYSGKPKTAAIDGKQIWSQREFRKLHDSRFGGLGADTEWPRVKTRTEIINGLIDRFDYRRYLEIGIATHENFNAIKCAEKVSVDPDAIGGPAMYVMTSDDFFATYTGEKFDIVFIDGLHTAEQVQKDIKNSLDKLSKNGTIVVHDCLPTCKEDQRPIEKYHGGHWMGTGWMEIARLRMTDAGLSICTVDADCGCAIIRRGTSDLFPTTRIQYGVFRKYRNSLMNVLPATHFYAWLGDQK